MNWTELRLALAAPRPADGFVSKVVTVGGIRTHYRRIAAGEGVPVVLLHGLAVSHRYLMPTARALAQRHTVYVPDLPGFGLSGKPTTVYGPTEHAKHVAALLKRLHVEPACVVGHSFGCEVAARLAVDCPEAVRALILVGPTSDPCARNYRGQVGRWLVDLALEDPRQAVILARDVFDAGIGRVVRTLGASVHNAIERDLAACTVPVLLLRGSRDTIVPATWLARAARACAGPAETATVQRAAHNAATTSATELATAIESFLTRRSAGPAVDHVTP